ncbi:MAG: GatB/YqeY domain-containing protein [Gammaproteobacteria bacterium WSBS_2016_MAG_OTU1]
MPIAQTIQKQLQDAMRAGEKLQVDVLRMLLSDVKKKQIDSGEELDEAAFLAIVNKLIKQRRDSTTQFRQAGREELASREEAEITILQPFLPPAPDADALAAAIDDAIAQSGADSMRDMGKVFAILKKALPAADMGVANKLIKEKLGG